MQSHARSSKQASVTVMVSPGASIEVVDGGAMVVQGTADAPVVFKSDGVAGGARLETAGAIELETRVAAGAG